ncbi:MAG: helix-turn-helix domain-containing protein [Pseudomonadota bacterium]
MLAATENSGGSVLSADAAEGRIARLHAPSAPQPPLDGPLIGLAPHDVLFAAGDLRTHVYRLVEGMLTLYEPAEEPGREPTVVGHAFAGETVGLGHLKIYSVTAEAMQACLVARLPVEWQDRIVATERNGVGRLADAIEQEFAFLRRRIVRQNADRPLVRLAAFLRVISDNNAREGRDPSVIADSLTSGTVAGMLGLEIDALARLLLELEERGIVVPSAGRLAILDPAALEALADS